MHGTRSLAVALVLCAGACSSDFDVKDDDQPRPPKPPEPRFFWEATGGPISVDLRGEFLFVCEDTSCKTCEGKGYYSVGCTTCGGARTFGGTAGTQGGSYTRDGMSESGAKTHERVYYSGTAGSAGTNCPTCSGGGTLGKQCLETRRDRCLAQARRRAANGQYVIAYKLYSLAAQSWPKDPEVAKEAATIAALVGRGGDPALQTPKRPVPIMYHEGSADRLAFTGDGKSLVASNFGYPYGGVFDLATRKEVGSTPGQAVAFDGASRIVTAGHKESYPVIVTLDGTAPATRLERASYCPVIAWTPDRTLLVGGDSEKLHVWDARTGKKLHERPAFRNVRAIAPLSATTAIVCMEKTLPRVYDLVKNEDRALDGASEALDVAATPAGDRFALAGARGTELWDGASLTRTSTILEPPGGTTCVAFSGDGALLATAARDISVFVYRVKDGTLSSGGVVTDDGGIRTITLSHDGRLLACSLASVVRVLDLDPRAPEPKKAAPSKPSRPGSLINPSNLAKGAEGVMARFEPPLLNDPSLSPDGRSAAWVSPNESAFVLEVRELESGRTKHLPCAFGAASVAWSADSKWIAVGGNTGTLPEHYKVAVYDLTKGSLVRTLAGHQDTVRALAFSPDAHTLAAGSSFKVKLWNLETGDELRTVFSGHDVRTVVFSPDGKTLATSGGNQGVPVLWDMATGKSRIFAGREKLGMTNQIVFSTDGKQIFAGTHKRVAIFDVEAGALADELPLEQVRGIAVSPDGRRLAARTGAGSVTVWDLATMEKLRTIGEGSARTFSFGADAKELVTATTDRVNRWVLGD